MFCQKKRKEKRRKFSFDTKSEWSSFSTKKMKLNDENKLVPKVWWTMSKTFPIIVMLLMSGWPKLRPQEFEIDFCLQFSLLYVREDSGYF